MTETAIVSMSDDQVALIKRTLCKGATDDELALFISQCKRTGLDPFSRQIHAVKRWSSRDQRELMSIQVGIDGFRLIASRTSLLDGQDGPYWCGQDGEWLEVWAREEPPVAAKVIVYRKGCSRPFCGIAHWSEYHQTYYDQKEKRWTLTSFWADMPAGQLAKCAEALALRKAFPQELSGIYSPEEMSRERVEIEQAVVSATPTAQTHPAENLTLPAPQAADATQRLLDFEDKLVTAKRCKQGDLVRHIEAELGADWASSAVDTVKRVCVAFAATHKAPPPAPPAMATAGDLERIEAELERTGETVGRILAALGMPKGSAVSDLNVDQVKDALGRLAQVPDKSPARR